MKKTLSLLDKNKRFFLLTLLVGIVYSAISVAIPTISGRLITSVVADSANRTRLLCIFLLISLFQLCFAELDEYMGNTLKIRQKKQMRRNAFHAFSAQDSAKREDISAFVSFVNNDIPSVAEQYVLGTIDMIKCMSILAFSALSLLYIHWVLALVIVGVSLLIVALPNTMRKRGGAARKRYSGVLANYNTTLRSILDGLRLVKAYRCRKYAAESVDSADDGIARSEMTLLKYQLVTQGITTALQVAKTVLILLIGLYLISKKEIDVGSLVAVIQLAEVISAPIEVLAYLRHGRNEVLPILAQYQSMIGRKPEGDDRRTACAGALEQLAVDHLSYRAEELTILKDVCARFTAGRKYLITGGSGSGKSTLLRLIAQIGDLQYGGRILYNGHEIRTIPYGAYYESICPVFQEPYLFYATLEDNICVGRPIPRDIYLDVIRKLNLEYLLDRYHGQELTQERMETLSGGERQRVALARAMVGRPSVYLLDEVTSALDQANAELVERLLLEEPSMVLHICHKPNPALRDRYDGIYELSDGVLTPVDP